MDLSKVVSFSGGKDSTATILYLRELGVSHQTVFCDTGWEHPLTIEYIEYINQTLLNGKLITLTSEKYPNGMRELVKYKKRVPSVRARFCTDYLKVRPMLKWLKNQEIEFVYQGIRADESPSRSKMDPLVWSDDYDAYVARPIFHWKAEQVFEIHRKYKIKPNPLYKLGAGRVGCFPCVLINHAEIKRMQEKFPDIWDKIEELETITGRSFFPPNYIPKRFHTGFDEKSGKSYPTKKDVLKYISGKR